MWFKRRKKSEQDHALSESLRSLQSLLSETGRHEPNFDPPHMPSEESAADASADPRPGQTLAAHSRNGTPREPEHCVAPTGEPEAPGGSGSRWRDLNLSFDAEPVTLRARRKGNAVAVDGADDGSAAPERPGDGCRETTHEPLQSEPGPGAADASDSGDTPAVADRDLASDYDFSSGPDDDVLVLDLEETISEDPGTSAPEDEREEDQLHLELDPSEASEADIPVLTNAVYVPKPLPEEHVPPGPAASPHEAPVARCIDRFRVRLQITGLDSLSPQQETALHDTLVEFLDELEHD